MTKNTSVREAAKAAGVSPTLVSRKRGRGMTDAQIEEEARRRAQTLAAKARPAGKSLTFAEAQRRKEQALAELRELELAVKRGELVEAAAVRAEWVTILSSIRDGMLALPAKASGRLAAMTDARLIERFLKATIRAELTKLADGFAEPQDTKGEV